MLIIVKLIVKQNVFTKIKTRMGVLLLCEWERDIELNYRVLGGRRRLMVFYLQFSQISNISNAIMIHYCLKLIDIKIGFV